MVGDEVTKHVVATTAPYGTEKLAMKATIEEIQAAIDREELEYAEATSDIEREICRSVATYLRGVIEIRKEEEGQ